LPTDEANISVPSAYGLTLMPVRPRGRYCIAINVGALLEAAKTAFATSGVDAPAKEIAALAGVGVGTL
jgi:hypothetical protein